MAKMCTVSRLERQFATLCLFHAPTRICPPQKKVWDGKGLRQKERNSGHATTTIARCFSLSKCYLLKTLPLVGLFCGTWKFLAAIVPDIEGSTSTKILAKVSPKLRPCLAHISPEFRSAGFWHHHPLRSLMDHYQLVIQNLAKGPRHFAEKLFYFSHN